MGKVIIFDLYDTVLKDISFNFDDGLVYLHKAYFQEICSLKELIDYAATFLPLYEKRKIEHTEICLIKDEIVPCFEKFGVPIPKTLADVEYAIMNSMQKVTLTDDVRYTLEELDKRGIPMYILSNSIFTGNCAKQLLNDLNITHYFKKLYSSADYGIRKPSREFYQIAVDEILLKNPAVRKEDILYVGNDYITDIIGATSSGLKTVWYNVKHLPNEKKLDIWDIDSFKKILEIVNH